MDLLILFFLQLLLTNNKCIKMNLRYSLNRQ